MDKVTSESGELARNLELWRIQMAKEPSMIVMNGVLVWMIGIAVIAIALFAMAT